MTRVTIDADALAAAYTAHRATAHGGNVGRRTYGGACPTCRRYAAALTLARATPQERP